MDKQSQTKERYYQIKSIQQFVSNSKEYLNGILLKLDWSEEATFLKEGEKRLHICPQNEEHRVGYGNIQKHLEKCCWHQSGYKDDSVALPEAGRRFATTVVLDKSQQAEVILKAAYQNPTLKIRDNVREREVPQTSDRVFSDFTTDERRILYDYVVSRTSAAVPRLSEFSLPSGQESKPEPLTREQVMAAERDAKRRRVRYRTAKVHTKSKNYSEVMREVINNQMLAYEDWLREQCNVAGPSTSVPLEKTNLEEPVKNKQEMIWLDWDYRTNPYVRWKYLLEQEKRRAGKNDTKGKTSNRKDDRKKYNEPSTSRRSSQSDESRKHSYTEYHKRHSHGRESKEKDSKGREIYSKKEHHRDHYERNYRKVEHSRRDKTQYKQEKYHEGELIDNGYQWKHDSRYKEYQSKSDNYKSYKYEDVNARKHDMYHSERDSKSKIKREFDEYSNHNASLNDYDSHERHRSVKKYKTYNNDSTSSESDKVSDVSSYTKSQHKRKKKSKKKHKKKHKSKRS